MPQTIGKLIDHLARVHGISDDERDLRFTWTPHPDGTREFMLDGLPFAVEPRNSLSFEGLQGHVKIFVRRDLIDVISDCE